VEYSTDLFGREMIRRLLDHFRVYWEGIVAAPEQRIIDVAAAYRSRASSGGEWNTTETDYPADALIHELFEARPRARPRRWRWSMRGGG